MHSNSPWIRGISLRVRSLYPCWCAQGVLEALGLKGTQTLASNKGGDMLETTPGAHSWSPWGPTLREPHLSSFVLLNVWTVASPHTLRFWFCK